jgi:putative Mn2+ efflux pump MntP
MELYDLVMPLGIITYILIILAILTGRRIIKLHPKWHKIIATLTIIFATIHAGIVIWNNV